MGPRELRGALLVNPYDMENTANAIAMALSMRRTDRVARWREMFDQLSKNDVNHWCSSFLDLLEEPSVLKAAS